MAEELVATNATTALDQLGAAQQVHNAINHAIETSGVPILQGLNNQPVVFFLLLAFLGFIASYLFVFLCKTVIKAFTRRTETDLDDILLDRLQHPVAWSLFLVFLWVALVPLSLQSTWALVVNKLLTSGNIILIGTILNRIIGTLLLHYGAKIAAETESAVDDHVLPIFKKMITAVIYAIVILIILAVFGVQVAPLLAGAGIAGIAIAFALQESLRNIFGGISLAFDRSFAAGDRVKLNDGTVGTVVDISLRSTKIRSFDGDLIVVPNGKIANENFQTYAQPTAETRVTVAFSVAYGTDLDLVDKVVAAAVKGIPNQVVDEKRDMRITVQFLEMGPYSLHFKTTFWVDDYRNSWDAKLAANRRVYEALLKAKIEIPYPVQTVQIKK